MGGNKDLSASQRDYLAAIFALQNAQDAARAKDIAERMGVLRASVTGAKRIDKKSREKENSLGP